MTKAQTFDLSGKLVLVTGATRGIGRAVAIGAASAGAELIITGRTTGALEEVEPQAPYPAGYHRPDTPSVQQQVGRSRG